MLTHKIPHSNVNNLLFSSYILCLQTNKQRTGKYVLLQEIIQHSPPKQSNGQQSETPAAHEQSFGDL